MNSGKIEIKQFVFSKIYHFLIFPLLAVLVDQINMLNNAERSPIRSISGGGIFNYILFFSGNLFLFEIITIGIFSFLLRFYYKRFKLDHVGLTLKQLLIYELKWIPLFIFSIFIFGPITNFFRYLVVFFPFYGWSRYFPEFVFTGSMFLNYLFPILLWGFVIVNINLVWSYLSFNKKSKEQASSNIVQPDMGHYLKTIECYDNEGSTMLSVDDICWFEVIEKAYYANLQDSKYQVKKTISELEENLDPLKFFRINRSQLVNLQYIKSYSYWEFEKYIIKLYSQDLEFLITRKRYKSLKSILEKSRLVFGPKNQEL
jgi:two-component system, LytTR family, response regulator